MSFWESETIINEIPKTDFAKYIISICEKNGKKYLNVREWYSTKKSPKLRPGKSGICMPIDVAGNLLEVMRDAIQS